VNEIWLIRHGETAWSLSGQHTSRTDVPLTEAGRQRAEDLRRMLAAKTFALVLSSPKQRALDTCTLAGYSPEVTDDLFEWDYGEYEGLATPEIQKSSPGWTIWTGAVPGGETAEQVAARADRVIARASAAPGDVALFGHGHFSRVLAARWIGLGAAEGRRLALSTGSVSVLGHERATQVIRLWNRTE
jgi:probable phosphoglycerate mutase